MIKKLLFRLLAAISNSPEWKRKYVEYSLQYTLQRVRDVYCLRMSEAKKAEFMNELGKMQNNSGKMQGVGYTETNTLGKMQNASGKNTKPCYPILNLLHSQQGLKRCLDRTIIAVIEYQGKIYIGTNGIKNEPTECPRSGYTINQGYELCRTVCKQPYHAEEAAIAKWLIDCSEDVFDENLEGIINYHNATISIYGAKAMCERCKELCKHYKLRVVKVTPDLMGFLEHGKND